MVCLFHIQLSRVETFADFVVVVAATSAILTRNVKDLMSDTKRLHVPMAVPINQCSRGKNTQLLNELLGHRLWGSDRNQ